MSTSFTPGPWFVFDGAHLDNGPGAFCIGDAPESAMANILCSRHQWPEKEHEMRANARLIAAAPELLQALQAIVALDDGDSPDLWHFDAEFKAGIEAIAKATGEQQ
jgi:hypothetical protein